MACSVIVELFLLVQVDESLLNFSYRSERYIIMIVYNLEQHLTKPEELLLTALRFKLRWEQINNRE